MTFVTELRDELVAAAEREQTRRLPRIERPGPRLVLTAAAAAVMALAVVLAISALNTRPLDDDPAVVAEPTPEARDLFGGTLEPDVRYRTRDFVPTLSFAVPDDLWYVEDTTRADALVLDRRRRLKPGEFGRQPGWLAFDRLAELHDPTVRGLAASRIPAPADLYEWLRHHPDLRVGASESVTVANVPGRSFPVEVRFTRPAHSDPFCRQRYLRTCTLLAPGVSFLNGTRLRIIILATEPQPLIVSIGGYSERALATVEKAAAPVLDTLRIGVR
jgi:hypothetical protein